MEEADVNSVMGSGVDVCSASQVKPQGELLNIGSLFSETWGEMQAHFSLIASIMSVPFVFYFLASLGKGTMTPQYMLSSGLLFVIFQLVGGIIMILATIGIVKQIKSNWTLTVGDTYKLAMPYFWPLVWVSFLSGLVVIGGFLLLLVPGIILAVMVAFSRIAVILDEQTGMNALMWSKELVHGLWWEVFKRLISLGLLLGVVSILLGIVPYIGSALSILTVPFSMMFVVRLYDELKALKVLVSGVATHGRGMLVGAMVVGIVAIPLMFIAAIGFAMLGSYQNSLFPSGILPSMNSIGSTNLPTQNTTVPN